MSDKVDLRNKNVVVVGLASSGFDACMLLIEKGAIVKATDAGLNDDIQKNADFLRNKYFEVEIGSHSEAFLNDADLIVASPGVPKDSIPIKYACENNIPVISEIELGYWFCEGPIIAITGTNGKSTVVTLLGDIFKEAGRKYNVCGNIGNSLCGEIKNIDEKTTVILEVSSFQLEWIVDFKPAVSCILNITEDHLERYKDLNDYALAKYRVFLKQDKKNYAILNYDDPMLKDLNLPMAAKKIFYSRLSKIQGYYAVGTDIKHYDGEKISHVLAIPGETCLKGGHNVENVMAAVIIALTQKISIDAITSVLKKYKLLPHRLEYSGEVNGVVFIDDSKATNIDSTKRALEAMEKKVVLIAGGRDKGGDYNTIKPAIKEKVRKIILVGEAAPLIRKAYDGVIEMENASSIQDAVQKAYKAASKGDIVLLSPMCSSFDMFASYKHRGDAFQEAVKELLKEA